MCKFKAGDKVICIDDRPHGKWGSNYIETYNNDDKLLVKGKEYKISHIIDIGDGYIKEIVVAGSYRWWHQDRFILSSVYYNKRVQHSKTVRKLIV